MWQAVSKATKGLLGLDTLAMKEPATNTCTTVPGIDDDTPVDVRATASVICTYTQLFDGR
jgi:hypothetical protein